MGTFSPSFDTGNISVEDGNILIKGDDGKDYVMPLKRPVCYDAPIGSGFEFTGPVLTVNNGNMLANGGAAAPASAPFRFNNSFSVPILLTGFRIRYGANGYTGAGVANINGEAFSDGAGFDIDGLYRTVPFTPDNGTGVELAPGFAINGGGGSNFGATIGPFQGPVSTGGQAFPFGPGTQARAEVDYIIGTPAPQTIRGHEYSDGETSLFVYFDGNDDPVTIDATNIPAGWTEVTCEDEAVLSAQYRTGITINAADISPINSVVNVDTGTALTIPAGVFLAANAGASVTVRNSTGGNVTITPDVGVTLEGDGDLVIANGEAAELVATDTDDVVWVIC